VEWVNVEETYLNEEDVMRNVIFALPIMLLLAMSSANAQRGRMWMDKDLQLTEQQQQQMEDLRFQHQKAMIQKKAALKTAELEMRNMMQKANLDEKAVLAKQKEISTFKAAISEERVRQQIAMRKILNAEQLQKFLKMHRGRGFDDGFHRGDRGMHKGMRSRDCTGPGNGAGPGMGKGSR
jgi:Spy/CpxP family protein refolding chaperone